MDIKQFEEKLFQQAIKANFTDCEIYFVKDTSFNVNIFNGEIYQYKNAESQGVSFRGTYDGRMCYSYSEKVDFSIIDNLIDNAIVNGKLIESPDKEGLFYKKCDYPKVDEYSEALNKTTTNEKIQMAKDMEKIAYDADKRVKIVNSSVVGNMESELYISNTLGLSLHSKSNFGYGYSYVTVAEGEQNKIYMEKWIGKDFKDFDITKVATTAVNKALESLGATTVESCKVPVVFDNITSCDLLSVFTSSFLGDTVDKGFSKLKGKIGEKIASDIVTICDDGVIDNHLTNVSFDSEGVPTLNKVVVENGILKTFLHNTKTANKFNVPPTGNGYKASFKGSIGTGVTNFYIKPTKKSFDELIKPINYGVLITDLAGLHSGVNTISGNFSLLASGFIIKDGKLSSPVEQITVAGNFFDLLLNITNIGNDLKFDFPSSLGAIGSPSILVDKLSISGI